MSSIRQRPTAAATVPPGAGASQEPVEFLDESEQEEIVQRLYRQNDRIELWSKVMTALIALVSSGFLAYTLVTPSRNAESSLATSVDAAALVANALVAYYLLCSTLGRTNRLAGALRPSLLMRASLIVGLLHLAVHREKLAGISFGSADTFVDVVATCVLRIWFPLSTLLAAGLWAYVEYDAKSTRNELAELQRAQYKYKRI